MDRYDIAKGRTPEEPKPAKPGKLKCNCGKRVPGVVRIRRGLNLCPDCLEYCAGIKQEMKRMPGIERGIIYGTKIEGVVTKKFLKEIKKMIKSDLAYCEAGSQNPPLFEILWECKSAEDAIKHGYTEHTWYRCRMTERTIVSMEYLVRDIDALVGSLESEPDNLPVLNKNIDIDAIL